MNKKQQTLNPEAAVEMVIKMQDRQTNARTEQDRMIKIML